MLKIAVCDDEQYYRDKIHELLVRYMKNRQLEYRVDLYSSGEQFLCQKENAVRYIMKDTLDESIPECMDAVLNKMSLKQVAFPFIEGVKKLFTDNILYVESRKHKSYFFYMESEIATYQIYDKLDNIEQQLCRYGFLRIHKSYLVNMKHITKISNYTAFLDVGEELPVPRLKYQAVKEAYAAYKGAM